MTRIFDNPIAAVTRRSILAGIGTAAALPGARSLAGVTKERAVPWQDDAWLERYPTLGKDEGARRIDLARTFMRARDLDCLVIASPEESHDFVGSYFAGDGIPVVVIPREGKPAAFQPDRGVRHHVGWADGGKGPGSRGWIADWMLDATPRDVANHLTKLGMAKARIGCIGFSRIWPVSSFIVNGGDAWTSLPFQYDLSRLLPSAQWIDVWPHLLERISVMSEDALQQFNKAARLAELASETFIDALRIGGTEAEAMAAAAYDVFSHGGFTPEGGAPYVSTAPLANGDVVTNEIIVYVGGIEAQAGWTVCMGEPDPTMRTLIDAAHHSYALGLAALRPGLRVGDLEEIMQAPFRAITAYNMAPIFHGLNPIYTNGETSHTVEKSIPQLRPRFFGDLAGPLPHTPTFMPDIVLRPGMVIHLEPNGQIGNRRVFLGANVLITEDGKEEYSDRSRRVHIKTSSR